VAAAGILDLQRALPIEDEGRDCCSGASILHVAMAQEVVHDLLPTWSGSWCISVRRTTWVELGSWEEVLLVAAVLVGVCRPRPVKGGWCGETLLFDGSFECERVLFVNFCDRCWLVGDCRA